MDETLKPIQWPVMLAVLEVLQIWSWNVEIAWHLVTDIEKLGYMKKD